jgi:integrase
LSLSFEGKFQLTKTQKAVRTIPLGRHAVKALSAHRAGATRTAAGDLVFGSRKGDPLREAKLLTKVLQPAAEKAGLGRVTWHQFRHIHSSLLNDLRVPVKIAQEQLGHASISTTLNIYTHTIAASHREAVEAVEGRLFSNVLELPDGLPSASPISGSEHGTCPS